MKPITLKHMSLNELKAIGKEYESIKRDLEKGKPKSKELKAVLLRTLQDWTEEDINDVSLSELLPLLQKIQQEISRTYKV